MLLINDTCQWNYQRATLCVPKGCFDFIVHIILGKLCTSSKETCMTVLIMGSSLHM